MLKKFKTDISGNFSVMMAIGLLILLGAVGLSVDYVAMTNISAKLQSANDGAVLTAAQAGHLNESEAIRIADESFRTLESSDRVITRKYEFSNTGVNLVSYLEYDPVIMGVLGFGAQTISVSSTALTANAKGVDIALVLDVTASMQGSKIFNLKNSITALINEIESSHSDVRISIVPYSHYVNVNATGTAPTWVDNSLENINFPASSLGASHVTVSPNRDWDGCVGSRTGMNWSVPEYAGIKFEAVYDDGNSGAAYDYTKYGCPVASVLPLTNNLNDARAKVSELAAKGRTYMPIGLMWGWRTLDPRLPYSESASTEGTRKQILVLMTDGGNSVYQSSATPYHGGHYHLLDTKELPKAQVAGPADDRTADICESIKTQTNIAVYTIAFDIDDDDIIDLIRGCASGAGNFYEADADGSSLSLAFQSIREKVDVIRLTF